MLFEYGQPCAVSDLPADPKTWTPSQLSVYVSGRFPMRQRKDILTHRHVAASTCTEACTESSTGGRHAFRGKERLDGETVLTNEG